jgi:hypothetical protein
MRLADVPSDPRTFPLKSDPDESDALATGRIRRLSALLLDRESRLLALAARLDDGTVVFESSIRGSSMSPAIPALARLRVRLLERRACQRGDVLFYLSETGFVAHRLVHLPRLGATGGMLLTCGDNCLVPDAPIRRERVLGTVVEVYEDGEWRPPGPPCELKIYYRFAKTLGLCAMRLVMLCSYRASHCLATALKPLEARVRHSLGRLLRRLRLISPAH